MTGYISLNSFDLRWTWEGREREKVKWVVHLVHPIATGSRVCEGYTTKEDITNSPIQKKIELDALNALRDCLKGLVEEADKKILDLYNTPK